MSNYSFENVIIKHGFGDYTQVGSATAITGTWSSSVNSQSVTEDTSSGSATTELTAGDYVVIDTLSYEVLAVVSDDEFTRSAESTKSRDPALPAIVSKTAYTIGTGLTATLQAIGDGLGTASDLQISTAAIKSASGDIYVADNLNLADYDDGAARWLAVDDGGGDGAGDGNLVANVVMIGGIAGPKIFNASDSFDLFKNDGVTRADVRCGDINIRKNPATIGVAVKNYPMIIYNKNNDGAAGIDMISMALGISSNTTGQTNVVSITRTYNQASGDGANTDLLINRTETAVGSGTQLLIDAQVAGDSKFSVSNTGEVTIAPYFRYIDIEPGSAVLGPTAPSAIDLGTYRGLEFDADAERVNLTFEVPDDWVNDTDMVLKIYWTNDPGTAIGAGETVKFDISYRVTDMSSGELYDNGSAATGTVTYTQSGAGTDKQTRVSEITLAHGDANQPLETDYIVGISFDRDVTGDTYPQGACVFRWEVKLQSNSIPNH
jgi:hypothetical protein